MAEEEPKIEGVVEEVFETPDRVYYKVRLVTGEVVYIEEEYLEEAT